MKYIPSDNARSDLPARLQLPAIAYLFCLIIFSLLLAQILLHPLRIGSEPALALQCAKLVYGGASFYRDFLVLVSPLTIYLALIPVVLSSWLKIDTILCFNLTVFFLAIFCLIYTSYISRLPGATEELGGQLPDLNYLRSPTLLAVQTVTFAGANLLALFQFGQAQHLLLLFAIPYLMTRWQRLAGKPPTALAAVFSGVFAAIGFNLTFAFLPIFFVWEIALLFWHRKLRLLLSAEVATVLVCTSLYFLHLHFLPDTIRQTFFNYVVPLNLAQFLIFDPKLIFAENGVVRDDLVLSFTGASIICLALSRTKPLLIPLAILNTAGFSLFILNNRGLSADCFICLFAALAIANIAIAILGENCASSFSHSAKKLIAVAGSCLLTIFCCRNALLQSAGDLKQVVSGQFHHLVDDYGPCAMVIAQFSKPGQPIVFLCPDDDPAFPAILQLNRQPVTFLLDGKPLQILARLEANPEIANQITDVLNVLGFSGFSPKAERETLLRRLKAELAYQKPELFLEEGEDLISYLQQSGIQAEISSHYLPVAESSPAAYSQCGLDQRGQMEHAGFRQFVMCWKRKPNPRASATAEFWQTSGRCMIDNAPVRMHQLD